MSAALSPQAAAAVALTLTVGRREATRLLKTYNEPVDALAAVPLTRDQRASSLADAQRIGAGLAAVGGRVEVITNPAFPPLLYRIEDAPSILYCLGPAPLPVGPTVAIVGSRRPTGYGLTQAERLARELAVFGVVVVSGLAMGIDSAAHRGALAAGGATVAVLGTGVNQPYPASSRQLYREIAARGLLVSEFPLDAGPRKEHFPQRNRLISGLSKAVVVVESRSQSGTRHTVECALAQGRDVCAVPGPLTSTLSEGPHRLIRQGAALVRSAADILEATDLTLLPGAAQRGGLPLPADADAIRVLEALLRGPQAAEVLAVRVGLPAWTLAATLSLLEMGGFVIRQPDGTFAVNPIYAQPQHGGVNVSPACNSEP